MGPQLRNATIGTTLTGFAASGAAFFWCEVLSLFTGISRKMNDEAGTIETEHHPRRVA